jgi:hypothetical protein
MDDLCDRFEIEIRGALIKLTPKVNINKQLGKNRTQGFSSSDHLLWKHYEFVEHLVYLAKTQSLTKLQQSK